jgi:hypothetical protein
LVEISTIKYHVEQLWKEFHLPIWITGKSLSEALILGSTNPQYDKRLFIDLRVQYMKTISSAEDGGEHVVCLDYSECQNNNKICVHNMFSPCSELVVFLY